MLTARQCECSAFVFVMYFDLFLTAREQAIEQKLSGQTVQRAAAQAPARERSGGDSGGAVPERRHRCAGTSERAKERASGTTRTRPMSNHRWRRHGNAKFSVRTQTKGSDTIPNGNRGESNRKLYDFERNRTEPDRTTQFSNINRD